MAAGAVPFALPTTSGAVTLTGLSSTHQVLVMGASGAETGGSAAVTAIIRTTGSTGKVLCTLGCDAGGADHDWKGPMPVRATSGKLYCQIVGTGTLAGSVFVL